MVQEIAKQVQRGDLQPEDINEDLIAAQLFIPDLPEPDLFIRTGGEKRVSNFSVMVSVLASSLVDRGFISGVMIRRARLESGRSWVHRWCNR